MEPKFKTDEKLLCDSTVPLKKIYHLKLYSAELLKDNHFGGQNVDLFFGKLEHGILPKGWTWGTF